MKTDTKIIAVIGATGFQGKGVVNALTNQDKFRVRAITRNPDTYTGKAHEVMKADLTDVSSLENAFKDAHGVFLVTNFWEGADEYAQSKNAIAAACKVGVQHFIWSTLPDVELISNGEFDVPHFTGKAKVDKLVKDAGFTYHTFVRAPFYYQNFTGILMPQPKEDGTKGWMLPINSTKKIHLGDINDLGKVVAGAFTQPEKVGYGSYLSLATEYKSFNDIVQTYQSNGHNYSFTQIPGETFASFFEGAKELAAMFGYIEKYSYMGPKSEPHIVLAKEIANTTLTSFNQWVSQN